MVSIEKNDRRNSGSGTNDKGFLGKDVSQNRGDGDKTRRRYLE